MFTTWKSVTGRKGICASLVLATVYDFILQVIKSPCAKQLSHDACTSWRLWPAHHFAGKYSFYKDNEVMVKLSSVCVCVCVLDRASPSSSVAISGGVIASLFWLTVSSSASFLCSWLLRNFCSLFSLCYNCPDGTGHFSSPLSKAVYHEKLAFILLS